ncbi:hypothetical protein RXV86_21295 [Alisedimentitalea sp. MJ-SS2]|uniref:hypothetical protein n=1 Tax=Aliisedimentitalea sp. MJ-SS2 TaxID=3049795 RepID=UPI00290714BB|nr:hypothetical protein [Alisedimentitalea sp. MJ-SS2]MDU8929930.1 hypothetical protein [Alisedimentitalea sp. MJ-SS2]
MTQIGLKLLVAALLGAALSGANHASDLAGGQDMPAYVLNFPDASGVMVVQVTLGRLPDRAELHFELKDGTFVGAIAPFGQTEAASDEQYHLMAIQLDALPSGPQEIIARLVHPDGSKVSLTDELRGLEIIEIQD